MCHGTPSHRDPEISDPPSSTGGLACADSDLFSVVLSFVGTLIDSGKDVYKTLVGEVF